MEDDDVTTAYDDTGPSVDGGGESWLAEQARLVLLEDGS
jgi:hypothetical protein